MSGQGDAAPHFVGVSMDAAGITQGKQRQVHMVVSLSFATCLILQFGKIYSIVRNGIPPPPSPCPFFLKFSFLPFMAGEFSPCFCDRMNNSVLYYKSLGSGEIPCAANQNSSLLSPPHIPRLLQGRRVVTL